MSGKWQVLLGGAMAVLTCAFAVWRYLVSNQTTESLMTNLIVICGTIVSMSVLLVAIKSILENSQHKETFSTVLKRELDVWERQYYPLIFVDDDNQFNPDESGNDQDGACYLMLTDHRHILRRGEKIDGGDSVIFFNLPSSFKKNDRITFYLRKSMFKEVARMNNEDVKQTIAKLSKDFANAISSEFSFLVKAHGCPEGPDNKVTVIFQKDLDTPEEARELVKLLSYVTILYLAAV